MRKVAGALIATVAGLIALLSFKSHTPAGAMAAAGSGTSALTGTASGSTPAPAAGSGGGSGSGNGTSSNAPSASASSPAAAGAAKGAGKNGTYTGSSVDTMYGPVQVSATISGGKLTDVSVLQVPDRGGYEQQIVAVALPMLHSEALSAQSANIDIVSGATYTSQGYAQSLQSALNQAGMK